MLMSAIVNRYAFLWTGYCSIGGISVRISHGNLHRANDGHGQGHTTRCNLKLGLRSQGTAAAEDALRTT